MEDRKNRPRHAKSASTKGQESVKNKKNKKSGKTVKAKKAAVSKKRARKKHHFFRNLGISLIVLLLFLAVFILLDIRGIFVTGAWDMTQDAWNTVSTFVSDTVEGWTSPSPTPTPRPMGSFTDLSDIGNGNDGELDANQGNTISVKDLSINPDLDPVWMNVLLLGADARNDKEPCRTDTMIICSVNTKTGEVKLSSIMRDTCVALEGHPSARINSAYFYGGAQLAMKTVNECFGLNIEKYVFVDFNGFASVAEALGGINIDITEPEMKLINKGVAEQYHVLIAQGRMEYDAAESEYYATELKSFGKNTHLNGMQTLGYARIRKIDSDYARTERQRNVLNILLGKFKGASVTDITGIVMSNIGYIRTNLDINTIVEIAKVVLGNTSSTSADSIRLPLNGTYKEETRNNESMLYDTNFAANARELRAFIYN